MYIETIKHLGFRSESGAPLLFIVSIVLLLMAPVARAADTVRDYMFTGTTAPGTLDTLGAFGPAGSDLGGRSFTAHIYFDRDIGYTNGSSGGYTYSGGPGVFNNTGPVPIPVPSPLVASSLTINGTTVPGGAGGFAEVAFTPDSFFRLNAAGFSFSAALTGNGASSFPVIDAPGSVDLSCVFECPYLFSQSVSGGIAGVQLGPILNRLTITDSLASPAAQILPYASISQQGIGVSSGYSDGRGSISIYGVSHGTNLYSELGSGSVTYWMEVVGPANTNIPVEFSVLGRTALMDKSSAAARVSISAALGSNTALAACSSGGQSQPCNAPASFLGEKRVYNVPSNTPIEIQLNASWDVACCIGAHSGDETAQASVTTNVAIDHPFRKRGYRIVFGAGENPNPVSLLSTLQREVVGITPEGLQDKADDARTHVEEACTSLANLQREARKQSGRKVSQQAAAQIVPAAKSIEALLGCD